jgi:hypothetical protein
VAAGQEADEDPLEHRVLADDDPPDLEQDRLGGGTGVGRVGEGAQVGAGCGGRFGRVGHVGLRTSGAGTSAGVKDAFARRSRSFLRVS